ncbi:ArnT family glycosyltransferase [Ramlibacter pallidus]|uniref:ArnT family glycosyltransferase n=1 Tax=Ramlibacter pallidus TaxID=2780087 RepID=UPI00338E2D75
MNRPTPAIVTQSAARRLPRWALLLLCAAYVVPGFVGREPWKNADIMAFGYMFEMATGRTSWLDPALLGQPPDFDALLPYWLGAWAIQLTPDWVPADFVVRLPFAALLVVTLWATWQAVYYLARTPGAQPVPFAFGGEAAPKDYARAIADAGLLALIACLGLAQLSHETTPSLAQLGFTAMAFYALAALPYRTALPALCLAIALPGLALSGAPAMGVVFAAGGALNYWVHAPEDGASPGQRIRGAVLVVVLALAAAAVAAAFGTWHWRLEPGAGPGREWESIARLVAWFAWPAWPLALWTVWRWRRQLRRRHVALPLWFAGVSLVTTALAPHPDRALLLGLPALAALAAFALPTFSRSVSALIDWFTLLFFSTCALIIWVIWISLQTGIPAKPAANVARLAPGFVPSFGLVAFAAAVAATLAWIWLVRWRTSRSREAIWKSLVLPASGAALGWLLVMTLWLPVLDYARSYAPVVQGITSRMDARGCVEVMGLTRPQIAALRYHGGLDLQSAEQPGECPWLVVSQEVQPSLTMALDLRRWQLVAEVRRPTDRRENLVLYKKKP